MYRAPTDNDMYINSEWKSTGLDRIIPYTYDITINTLEHGVELVCPLSLQAVYLANIAQINATWTIFNSGVITVRCDVSTPTLEKFLPRFGIRMFLNDNFSDCEYFGYGPNESYQDKHQSSYMDKFNAPISNMFEDYIKPQENSSHWNTEYVKLTDATTTLTATSDNNFSFNICEYTQEELASKAHNYELEKSGYKVLCLDYKMSGVGSGSCGPELLEQYQLNEKEFSFDFTLIIE